MPPSGDTALRPVLDLFSLWLFWELVCGVQGNWSDFVAQCGAIFVGGVLLEGNWRLRVEDQVGVLRCLHCAADGAPTSADRIFVAEC